MTTETLTRTDSLSAAAMRRSARQALARGIPLLIATAFTAATLGLAWALRGSAPWLAEMLLERGPTQPATLFLFGWGLGHALVIAVRSRRERAAFRETVQFVAQQPPFSDAPDQTAEAWRIRLLAKVRQMRGRLVPDAVASILSLSAASAPSSNEVLDLIADRFGHARDVVNGRYAPLKTLTALVPISGFLGTVLGMSLAIAEFVTLVGAGGGIEAAGLSGALVGLQTAFDTTLLALGLFVVLRILLSAVHRRDQEALADMEQWMHAPFTQGLANLAQQSQPEARLQRLADAAERVASAVGSIDTAMEQLQRRFSSDKLASILDVLGTAVPEMAADLRRMSESRIVGVTFAGVGAAAAAVTPPLPQSLTPEDAA